MASKKPTPKKQEPPEDYQYPADELITQEPEPKDEPVRPMAVPELTIEQRMEAIELRLKVTEAWTMKHQRYHFGREVAKE
jgi:hypothetical protein